MLTFRQYLEKVDPEEMRRRIKDILSQRQGVAVPIGGSTGSSVDKSAEEPNIPIDDGLDDIVDQGSRAERSEDVPDFPDDKNAREDEVRQWASTKSIPQLNKAVDTLIDRAADPKLPEKDRAKSRAIAGQIAILVNRRRSSPEQIQKQPKDFDQ